MTNTDIATRPSNGVVRKETKYSVMPMPARVAYANQIAGAADMIPRGLFDKQTGRPSPAKVFLVFEIGAMLGLEPMAALQGIDVIEGKAAISPALMTGLIRGAGHDLKIVETGSVEAGDFMVTVTLTRSDTGEEIVADFNMKRAQRAGLGKITLGEDGDHFFMARAKSGESLPWEKYTEDMVLWRAVGRLGRRGANDILNGIAYMPEELNAITGPDGIRDEESMNLAEADFIARIAAIDDKKDLADIFHEIKEADGWTPRVSAEFDSQFSKISKDSRPPKDGTPGNTGIGAIDGPKESPAASTERPESDENPPASALSPDRGDENVSDGRTAPAEEIVVPEETESEEEMQARIDHENYLAAVAEGAVEAPAKDGGLFDASALEGKSSSQR